MKKESYWLIAYDIRDGKRLNRVAKTVSSYGWRMQKSIFEAHADKLTILQMQSRLKQIIKDEDSILIIPVCEDDRIKRKIYGLRGENPMDGDYIVV
ncbi:CRISPR-associated endonuclease Cas2 [Treponema sp. OMZ 787]|uniref:CRISPR-associated endonuclease Cas2 n=1 Tax=Treponema sp. OMZ 787 TaxID=2563669 RepID=UPI0020A48E9C|nr:CRISPR-associated endonuclease Cas2 [Treponema sp. OMZ 787]UTC61738.1 CRISPR-associated endonuclease Cas2 [Treponema sp. OMZ 787]